MLCNAAAPVPSMAPPTVNVRSACDRCHGKKLRCIISGQSNVCDRCAEQGATCVFSPAGRNGRPPRTQPPADRAPSRDPLAAAPSPASGSNAEGPPAPSGGPAQASYNPSSQSHVNDASLRLSPFWNSLEPSSTFMEDGPFARLSPMDPPLLDTSGEAGQPPPAFTDDTLMYEFLQRTPPYSSASVEFPLHSDPQAVSQGATASGPPPASEPWRLLHVVQQKLREESSKNNLSMPSSSSRPAQKTLDLGIFFQLIEELHGIVYQSIDAFSHTETQNRCDFSTAMALATALGNIVEVAEFIADRSVKIPNPLPTPATSHYRPHSSRSSCSHSPSTRHLEDTQQLTGVPTIEDSRASSLLTKSCSDDNRGLQVRVGSFTPPEEVARPMLADLLLHQLYDSQRLLGQVRQRLVQAESTLPTPLGVSALPHAAGGGFSVTSSTNPPMLGFSTHEFHWTVVQLLNQIQTRIARLESMALDITRRTRQHERL